MEVEQKISSLLRDSSSHKSYGVLCFRRSACQEDDHHTLRTSLEEAHRDGDWKLEISVAQPPSRWPWPWHLVEIKRLKPRPHDGKLGTQELVCNKSAKVVSQVLQEIIVVHL